MRVCLIGCACCFADRALDPIINFELPWVMLRLCLYIVRQTIPWMGASLFGAAVVFLASQLLRIAPVFAGAHAGASELAAALGLLVIPVIGWALTPAFAISVFAVAGGMSARGEITALDSAGIDRWRLIAGPCLLGILVTAASAWIWLEAAPRSQRVLRQVAIDIAGKALVAGVEPGRFVEPARGLVMFANTRDDGTFGGVLLEDARQDGRAIQIVAKEATVTFQPGDRSLELEFHDGHAFVENGLGAPPAALGFKVLEVNVSVLDELGERLGFLPWVMSVSTERLLGDPPKGVSTSRWSYALWRRIGGPVGFMAMALVTMYLAFRGQWRRRGMAVGVAAAIFLGYHVAGRLGENLLDAGIIGAPAAALAPAATVILFISIVYTTGLRYEQNRLKGA
jgi:lipopolysaccharide export LptBFGC system permease protein LptF